MTGEVKKTLAELNASVKNGNGKGAKKEEDNRNEFYQQKCTNGTLAEAVLVKGLPSFLQIDANGQPVLKDKIELANMIIKPYDKIAYLNKAYEFESLDEIKIYVERAKHETIGSLFLKARAIWKKYIDASDHHINICAADTIFTYFHDKLGMTHYLIFVGDNDTGKTNNLVVFQYLGYRPLFDTSITPANIYTYLGSIEEGQGIILEDEADNIDQSQEKMRIYKVGYRSGTKVSRLDISHGRNQHSYWTYCFKAMTAERQPDSTIAKGFNERTFVIHCRAGTPDFDIAEVINHGDHPKYKALMDEIQALRKLLLVYRLLHYKDTVPDVDLNIRNREKQLCKPLIRLFVGTAVIDDIKDTLTFYLQEKRGRKANTLEAKLYSIIADLIADRQEEAKKDAEINPYVLKNEDIWSAITTKIEGSFIQGKPQSFETTEFDIISQKKVTGILTDKFGAKNNPVSEKVGDKSTKKRGLLFNKEVLDRVATLYNASAGIEIVKQPDTCTLPGYFGTLQQATPSAISQENTESKPITTESR